MVEFHSHIISDLLTDPSGGLTILSTGLSLPKLLTALLSLHHPSQGTLLILTPPPSLKSLLSFHLSTPIPDISSDLPSTHRLSLYSSGNICFVTPRIFIVDLLSNRVPVSGIFGLLLLNVHLVSESCTEAFIVRVLKGMKREICVWGFTDKPYAMVSGFCKAERIMKSLSLKKLHLWPRFQVYVSEELERDAPEVVDVRVPMSKYMTGIQKAIVEVMDACLKEMRKTNKVDVEDLTVENGLFKSFDEIVRRQLDPIWHTLGKKTKQLVSDLKTLRKLLDYLVRYDAVSYLKYLDTLRVSENFRSVWIFAESSYKIFDFAKKRVYCLARSNEKQLIEANNGKAGRKRKLRGNDNNDVQADDDASTVSPNSKVVLEEVLEEAPKWKMLREILEEIEQERQKEALLKEEDLGESEKVGGDTVLVACKDERSCMQLQDCIKSSPKKVLRDEWEKYLLSKVQLRGIQAPQKKKAKSKETKGFGILDGVIPVTTLASTETNGSTNKLEHDALLAAASEIREKCERDLAVRDEPELPVVSGKACKGRAKVQRKGGRANAQNSGTKDNVSNNNVEISDEPENSNFGNGSNTIVMDKATGFACAQGNLEGSLDKGILRRHIEVPETPKLTNAKPIPLVHFYALESNQPILDILKPPVIIVYHPDIAFVREIEVYKAENPSRKLKIYFLFYEDSTEVQKFEASIRRENGAFESLIRQKSLMMIPVDWNEHCAGLNSFMETLTSSSQNSITRKAGGRKEVEKEMQVIVDMREFMSSLPNVLHQRGMRIIPVTLEVGDYILSPLICVERKSIQDLFGSFTSGRLYNQVETMVRYYRIPVLLIEFSQDRSFSFQSASDIGDDVTPNSIISKLSLLALHFPRLRIIWSRSLHATAEIFASLKANQDEPDEAKAIRVGVPSEEGIVENDVRGENFNTSAVEFLRRLPGVTDSNYRAIMDGCKSLAEVALLPEEKLADLMGGHKAARTLRDFLDAKYPTLF